MDDVALDDFLVADVDFVREAAEFNAERVVKLGGVFAEEDYGGAQPSRKLTLMVRENHLPPCPVCSAQNLRLSVKSADKQTLRLCVSPICRFDRRPVLEYRHPLKVFLPPLLVGKLFAAVQAVDFSACEGERQVER